MRRFRFQEGRNCWRQTQARRLSALIDGEAYFAAVRRALIAARQRIFILAWDIHSELDLQRDGVQDGYPTELGKLLRDLLERNPRLRVHILLWDYAPIYALEREPLFFGDSPWDKHPRLHFVTDDTHPLAASHHQKIVVVDGETAFCGGFDLSKWRWDSSEHLAVDERRIDTAGKPYPPFHDVQMLVEGETAQALEELCRERWQRATGERLDPCETSHASAWPEDLVPLLQDQTCALARTLPGYKEQPEVREIERLYRDMIRSAERFIYIENQYLTSASIGRALRKRLRHREGPEIVIILPRETGNWLEQHTMDVVRARLLRPLREDDRHGRLRVYYPSVPDLEAGCLMVHAKLMIVDDRLLRIGSSNLSNRSMGLDTECDLCISARDQGSQAAVRGLRQRLLGMFLAVEPEQVAQAEAREPGLISTIESLRSGERTLAPLSGETDPEWERQLPDDRLIDPDRPLNAKVLGDAMVGRKALPQAHRRLWLSTGLVLLLLALAAAWRWTDLGNWLDPQTLAQSLSGVLQGPWGPGLLILAYLVGSLLAVPVTLLILLTALIYGPVMGAFYALTGSLLAASATYGIGAYLGGPTVERLSGGSVHRLSERLARRGILTVIAVRIVPVAPFTVINLFAGASRISLRDYLIGTAVGMMPGVAAMTAFSEGILALVQRADLKQFLVAALALVFIIGLTLLARHLFSQLNGRESEH
jgi:phosphatidylserine/phosphatidylglycerophosphate/cardiolipin synthase-like enzyme/uncharacterized membrane protein YdjX (TVP38/TMEM64 family)